MRKRVERILALCSPAGKNKRGQEHREVTEEELVEDQTQMVVGHSIEQPREAPNDTTIPDTVQAKHKLRVRKVEALESMARSTKRKADAMQSLAETGKVIKKRMVTAEKTGNGK